MKKFYIVKSRVEKGEWYFAWLTDEEVNRIRVDKRMTVEERKPPT